MKMVRCLVLLALSAQPALAFDSGTNARCGDKNRHLLVEASAPDARGGKLSLRLHDFRSLAGNAFLTWNIEEASASSVAYVDNFGFRWTPQTSETKKGRCAITLEQNENRLDIDVECHDLRSESKDLTGFLNPAAQHFSCELN